MVILQYMLLLLGTTYIITQSVIGMPIRKLVSMAGGLPTVLIYCPACTGFWVGLVLGVLGFWPFEASVFATPVQSAIGGCALGALWSEYVPSSVYTLEQGSQYDDQEPEKTSQGDDNG